MKWFSFLLVISALIFWGCPYGSFYHLASGYVNTYDSEILGVWKNITDTSKTRIVSIKNHEEDMIKITTIDVGSKAETALFDENYAWFGKVDNTKYIAIIYYDWEYDYTEYLYISYKIDSEKMITREVANEPCGMDTAFTSSEALYDFFKKHQNDDGFYQNKLEWKKIE